MIGKLITGLVFGFFFLIWAVPGVAFIVIALAS